MIKMLWICIKWIAIGFLGSYCILKQNYQPVLTILLLMYCKDKSIEEIKQTETKLKKKLIAKYKRSK